MAGTKRTKRERHKLREGNSSARFKRRCIWINSAPRGWRPRRRQMPGAGVAQIADKIKQKKIDKALDIVDVRGSEMPSLDICLGQVLTRIPAWVPAVAALVVMSVIGLLGWTGPRMSGLASSAPFLRSTPMLGLYVFGLISSAVHFLGDIRALEPEKRVEVQYEHRASWFPGETTEERDERISRRDEMDDAAACYPDAGPGRVTAVRDVVPGYRSLSKGMNAEYQSLVILELPLSEIADLRTRTRKIDPVTKRPAAITLEDRYGAMLADLVAKYGSRSNVLAKEQEADIERQEAELMPDVPHEEHTFDLDVLRLRRALPKTTAHTGTGNYFAKKVPTLDVGTQDSKAGQVITCSNVALGTSDAFIGGYVFHLVSGETRAIISHTDTTVELEGGLGNWTDGSGVDVYDAWDTIAVPWAQFWTDQGSTLMTSTNYVRFFTGAWAENVAPNTGFNADETKGYKAVFEGDPNAARADVNITGAGGSVTLNIGHDSAVTRHMRISGVATSRSIVQSSLCPSMQLIDIDVDNSSAGGGNGFRNQSLKTLITDCTFIPKDTEYGIYGSFNAEMVVRRCIFNTVTPGSSIGIRTLGANAARVEVESCIFDSLLSGLLQGTAGSLTFSARVSNCTFYKCTTGFTGTDSWQFDIINNIFLECGTNISMGAPYDEATSGRLAGPTLSRNNIFYGQTVGHFFNGTTTVDVATWAAYDRVDSDEELIVDPELVDPANGDFTPDTGSPCINSGHGSGVPYDVNGDAFDPNNPDIGAVSTGVVPPPVAPGAPSWAANTSGIEATDAETDGEIDLTWLEATPDPSGDVGYIVNRRTNAGPGAWVEQFRTVALFATVANNTNGTAYDFQVEAYTRIATENTQTPIDTDTATASAVIAAPDAPVITATDQENQSDVEVDIVAGDPADVSTIYYQIVPGGALLTWGNTVTGSDSETLTGLLVAPYVIYAIAEAGGVASDPSNLVFLTIQAADQYTSIRTALREWVKGVVGNPTVIWREPNAPQPARQYVSIKMDFTTPAGRDYHSNADTDGIETVVGDREFIFSIQVHGKPSNEDGSASISILERIRSSLEKRSTQATLTAAGLAFVREEGFGDLAGIGGTEFEARGFVDIRFRTQYSDTDDVGYIGTVEDPAGTFE